MRTLTATLQKAQEGAISSPLYQLTLTRGTVQHIFNETRILRGEHDESQYSHLSLIHI